MVKYEKPVIESTEDVAESVYMASGDVKTGVCPYGREFANAGADICQICSKTDGAQTSGSAFRADYKGCPYGVAEQVD